MEFKNNHDFLTLFERRLSEFTGAPFVVLTDCCTNAIFLALKYYNVQKCIIPDQTYVSVPQVIKMANIELELQDIEWEHSYNVAENIYDCAVGFKENMYKPGQVQCVSFQQKKSLPIGRGGAILLDDEVAYNKLKQMVWDGRSDSSVHISQDKNVEMGYHMYMTPDNAAKGVLLLNQYNIENAKFGSYKDYPKVSGYNFL